MLITFTLAATTLGRAQNVGIGTNTPAYKLDVNGRMRLRSANGQTAGLWLDGPSLATRGFIGAIDDNHVGIWGSGSSWNFSMNVVNGNTGIGVAAPTATLDIDGTMKLRGYSPKKGAVLSATDDQGNVTWARPVAFRVSGLVNNENQLIANGSQPTWRKVNFNNVVNYNMGLHYLPNSSEFMVPENGIYHFDLGLHWTHSYQAFTRIVVFRNGSYLTIAEASLSEDNSTQNNSFYEIRLSSDFQLLANDLVYIAVMVWENDNEGGILYNQASTTYFGGHLVARQ